MPYADPERRRAANRERARRWYAANKQRKQQSDREYRAANAERERNREYRQRTADARREYDRQRYADDPQRYRDKTARWRAANAAAAREMAHRRRARLAGVEVRAVTGRDVRRILASPCADCGSCGPVQLDHAQPLSRGGRHAIGNLLPLCRRCNRRKGQRTWSEYRYRDQLTERAA